MSFLTRLCLAATLMSPLPALSQTTTTEATSATVANGQKIGAWNVTCVAVAVGQTNCTLTQRIMRATDNAFVADLVATRNAEDATYVVARVPVGVFLPNSFAMRNAENETEEDVIEFIWQACNREVCEALVQLDEEQISTLSTDSVTMVGAFRPSAQSEPFVFQFSLNGMIEGLDAIRR